MISGKENCGTFFVTHFGHGRLRRVRVETGPELSDRPVQKMFQTGKNRQKPAGISRPFTVGYRKWLQKTLVFVFFARFLLVSIIVIT